MFSCVKALCVTTTTMNITKKKVDDLILLLFFLQLKQLRGVVTMALNAFTIYR